MKYLLKCVDYSWARTAAVLAASALLAAVLAACQPVQAPPAGGEAAAGATAAASDQAGDTSAAIPEVLISVDGTNVTIPPDFPGGIVRVTVQNNGSKDLDVGFARLKEGSSPEEVEKLSMDFEANLVPLAQMVNFMASFNPVPAGGSQSAIVDFKTGKFMIDATEHSEEAPPPGQPHTFGVFTADKIVGTVEPQADVKVEMRDFAFTMPDEIKAGKLLWEYQNLGDQWHMQFLVKPAPGVTPDEAMAALMTFVGGAPGEREASGPPPFEIVANAGIPPISPGERMWLEFALEPGTYVAGCPIPDAEAIMAGTAPLSHLEHGMHRVLTVK